MLAINYNYSSGVIIDRCPNNHGVWLDFNELEKVQIHREYWKQQAEENKEEWNLLIQAVRDQRQNAADETNKRNMRPTKYLINRIISNIIK